MTVPKPDRRPRGEGVRALERGLDILRAVNASGGIRAGALAAQIGIPRPTVYRLLETLEELGYVERGASNDLFRVTRRALSLGDGYDASILVAQGAGPILLELGKRFVWPFDLSVYEGAAMVIQETTHALSPLSIDRGMIGRRLPMLRTSAGRAYLAFCGDQERSVILRHLARLDEPEDRPFLERRALDRMIAETRARGHATRDGGEFNAKTASLAAPVLRDDIVLGCISVIWIRTAMSVEEARAQFVGPLRQAAQAILERSARGD
ncbi:MAG: DNA-binding transcriptional regulator [Rhodoblastus sp.]|nr:DNA-binding transcriptional regulator [Rhodoblastus sp.]MCB1524365.1 DNA-binding transcriptional regulator [Rhodoblastus sp.]MCO5085256.1 DNA-binding transcriptional regulator [Methylobacteriaceae bacterium]HPG02750.1 DNA-binding transcriptional regulator [Rhodoblastus sp.]